MISWYNYSREKNDFTISSVDGKPLITGKISSHGNGVFSSVITFVESGRAFSNSKIIGRKEIIFALYDNNVIQKDFTLDEKKLDVFFEKYNELK